ncbi:tyrosine-type recombinase/integrase [Aliivibrio fischeri]|uniref:tyrosine-type recombinase/integrase n=1 Tax=Aliivibrio fischeri TaxID=668 RepID=UPI0007C51111|nr:site-specific integrase [Aliivibrio fischeri]
MARSVEIKFYPLFGERNDLMHGNDVISLLITKLSFNKSTKNASFEFDMANQWLMEIFDSSSSKNSFKNYRGELVKFLNWSWLVQKKNIIDLKSSDIRSFLKFCNEPPLELLASASHSYFKDGEVNPKWKPFVSRNTSGIYKRKSNSIKTQLSAISSFYHYLMIEEVATINPAAQVLNRINLGNMETAKDSLFIGVDITGKALSLDAWGYCNQVLEVLAKKNPIKHERTRFLMHLMYSLYPRISEVSARNGFIPMMGHFTQHPKLKHWLFYIPNSKGGKARAIGCPDALMDSFVRYRKFMGLTAYPNPGDDSPLFPRLKAATHGRDKGLLHSAIGIETTRTIIMDVFSQAEKLALDNNDQHCVFELNKATPHSVRHTGITHDLEYNSRSIYHVSRDAGHSDIKVTSIYINKDTDERFLSGIEKKVTLG